MSDGIPTDPLLAGQVESGELTSDGAQVRGWVTVSSGIPREVEISVRASGVVAQTKTVTISEMGQPFKFQIAVSRKFFPPPLRIELAVTATDLSSATVVGLPMSGPAGDLQAIRIGSRQEFLQHVQSPSDRLKNSNLLFYISLFGLERFADDFAARSAAICVMAYRIMEGVSISPEVRKMFWQEIDTILSEDAKVPRGLWLRWHISVRLAAGYLAFRDKDTAKSASLFSGIGDFAFELSQWPSALTNVLIGIFLAGWVKYERKEYASAVQDWRRAEGVLRYGATIAQLTNSYAYGELANAIRVAQECYIGCRQAENGGTPISDPRIAPAGYELDIAHLPGPKYNLGL